MNCEKLLDELSLCMMLKPPSSLGGGRKSVASCSVKFPTVVDRLKIVGSLYLSSPMSLNPFTRPSPSTVPLNSPVEIC